MCTATKNMHLPETSAQNKGANAFLDIMGGTLSSMSPKMPKLAPHPSETVARLTGRGGPDPGKPTALPTEGSSGSGPDAGSGRVSGGKSVKGKGKGPAALVAPAAEPPVRIDRTFTSQSAPASSTSPRRRSIRGGKDVTAASAFGRSGLNIPQ